MYINVSEIVNQKNQLEEINSIISNNLNQASEECVKINNNIKSEALMSANGNLSESMSSLANEFKSSMTQIIDFLSTQISQYKVSNEDARVALEGLVSMINGIYQVPEEKIKQIAAIQETVVAPASNVANTPTHPVVLETTPEIIEELRKRPNGNGPEVRLTGLDPSLPDAYWVIEGGGIVSGPFNADGTVPGNPPEIVVPDDAVRLTPENIDQFRQP